MMEACDSEPGLLGDMKNSPHSMRETPGTAALRVSVLLKTIGEKRASEEA